MHQAHRLQMQKKTHGNNLMKTVSNICTKIEIYIQNDLQDKFEVSKSKNKTNCFENVYLIGNILGKIENQDLILTKMI